MNPASRNAELNAIDSQSDIQPFDSPSFALDIAISPIAADPTFSTLDDAQEAPLPS
jgi:hypothetical protein